MVDIMKEAGTKANLEHREFEQGLKKQRKEFTELLDAYQEEVDSFEERSELQKRDQITQQVRLRYLWTLSELVLRSIVFL